MVDCVNSTAASGCCRAETIQHLTTTRAFALDPWRCIALVFIRFAPCASKTRSGALPAAGVWHRSCLLQAGVAAKQNSIRRGDEMTGNATRGTVRKFITRALAAGALLAVYAFSTAAMTGAIMTAGVTTAVAQRGGGGGGRGGGARGGRGGGGRGGARGGGRGGRGGGRGGRGGRGRGYWRGGHWFPWIAPNVCHEPWTSRRVWCDI